MDNGFKELKNLFLYKTSDEISRRIYFENTYVMKKITLIFSIQEIFAVLFFYIQCKIENLSLLSFSLVQASIGFGVNFGYFILSHTLMTKEKISPVLKKCIQIAYFMIVLIWGMYISHYHYVRGEQMNMFYLVVFGISSFVTLPQGTSFISVSLPFIIFYIILFNEDQARGIMSLNYIGLAFICQLTSFMRYQLKIKQFSQMIKIENINALLGKESREDSMTGLRNRFALKDDLDCFKGKKVCVLMADIDFFKQFNDTFGHRVGDIVIKEIARTVKEVFEGEYCYRYGGDELMVIVPDATLVYMEDQVALWKKKISEIHIEGVGRKLSCSHGYAFGMVYNMKDLEKIHEEADVELYKAKENRSW